MASQSPVFGASGTAGSSALGGTKAPYVSALVHKKTIYKPDPATLPIAGRVDLSRPAAPDAFHMRKPVDESSSHLVTLNTRPFEGTSLAAASYVPHDVQRAKKPLEVVDEGRAARLAGLGRSVPGLSDTAGWISDKQLHFDHQRDGTLLRLPALKEKWMFQQSQTRVTEWRAESRSSYGAKIQYTPVAVETRAAAEAAAAAAPPSKQHNRRKYRFE